MDNFLRVGVIANTHGIHGEVKVFPTTDDVNRFKTLKEVILETEKERIPLHIQSVKFFKQMAILKFKEFQNINEVEKYKGRDLLISRENAVPLEEGEYFIYDIIGAKVVKEDETQLGELVEVLTTGANDVFVIKTQNDKEILLPVIEDCILSVDIENKLVVARIMPGLLD